MTTETDLHHALAAIEPPPSRLTSSDLLLAGRRRRRTRRIARSGFAAAGVAVVVAGGIAWGGILPGHSPASPSATPGTGRTTTGVAETCPVTALAPEPGIGTYGGRVTGIDPSGHYIVGYGTNAIVYHNGIPTIIHRPAGIGAGQLQATAVNADGIVVGDADTGGGTHGWAWRWQAGTLTKLPTPDVPNPLMTVPTGINARGDIVGIVSFQPPGTNSRSDEAAVEWPANALGTVRVLSLLAGESRSDAYAISDSGYVVGSNLGAPFYWDPTGQGHPLRQPAGHAGGLVFDIVGSTAYGLVGGAGTSVEAARWDLRTGDLTLITGYSQARWANAGGDMVMLGGTGGAQASVLLSGGRPVRLAVPAGGTAVPAAIASDRTVAGWIDPQDLNAGPAFAIWHC